MREIVIICTGSFGDRLWSQQLTLQLIELEGGLWNIELKLDFHNWEIAVGVKLLMKQVCKICKFSASPTEGNVKVFKMDLFWQDEN